MSSLKAGIGHLSKLQIEEIVYWPLYVQTALLCVMLFIAQLLCFFLFIAPQMNHLERLSFVKEESQKNVEYKEKQLKNLVAIEGMVNAKKLELSALLNTLPQDHQLSTLLTSISQKARESNLQIIQLSWGKAGTRGSLYQRVINIEIRGKYHDFVDFSQIISQFSNLVVFEQLDLINSDKANGLLIITTTAVTYQPLFVDRANE